MKLKNGIRRGRRLGLLFVILASVATRAVSQPTVEPLGELPGGAVASGASGVSSDGRFVVGSSSSSRTEAQPFRREAFLWSEEDGMIPLGLDPAAFQAGSLALGVSDDGRVVAGSVQVGGQFDGRFNPFVWTREDGFRILREIAPGLSSGWPHSVTGNGQFLVGHLFDPHARITRGFRWSPTGGIEPLDVLDLDISVPTSQAHAVSRDGSFIAGYSTLTEEDGVARYQSVRWDRDLTLLPLGPFTPEPTSHQARGISEDGSVVVGMRFCGSALGGFRWTEDDGFQALSCDATIVGVSGNGLVSLDFKGHLYLETEGPFDVMDILVEHGVIDAENRPELNASAISADGTTIVGTLRGDLLGNGDQAVRIRLSDCDGNGVPDELERYAGVDLERSIRLSGSERFETERDAVTFASMISLYGHPWERDSGQLPATTDDSPAARLRALRKSPGCDAFPELDRNYFEDVVLPATDELYRFEMLLGNEAYADAQDPTVGLDGIPQADLGDAFAFDGVAGIQGLLDEELALLRGRALAGTPEDWLDDAVHFPERTGGEDARAAVAVYNRLPPNAAGAFAIAYRSNYGVSDDYEAALRFPQGHGDAFGYYLTATKAYLDLVAEEPDSETVLDRAGLLLERLGTDDESLRIVENLARAMSARARAAAGVVELTFRRDYREDPEDPRQGRLFADTDPERAWSAADWATRGALGAYLDWAVLAHLTPSDPSRAVYRDELPELAELASTAMQVQGQLDTAGAGLDPLGLVQNVVPFGIDASAIDSGSGRSHYEQVRDAAVQAIENARSALELANRGDQRLREQREDLETFREQVEDTQAEFDQELIRIFGLPSPDDPLDNDLDPSTSDLEESLFYPDLLAYLRTEDDYRSLGMRPRPAPGEVQLAFGELVDANLRLERVEFELKNIGESMRSQIRQIALLSGVQAERIEIVRQACDDQENLSRRLEAIQDREEFSGWVSGLIVNTGRALAGSPEGLVGMATDLIGDAIQDISQGINGVEDEFDIERERLRVECNENIALQGIDDRLQSRAEARELEELIRRSSVVAIEVSVARQTVAQALGRLEMAVQRGLLLRRERDRLRTRLEGELLEERHRDLAFRVFRNNALQKYRAFYDLAARFVVLAARAYAYEFNARSEGDNVLTGIYRERKLGSPTGVTGGLRGVLLRLDNSVTVNNFNNPLDSIEPRTFSLRRNLLGIGTANFPDDDLQFRSFLESHIVDRVEEVPEIRDLAQLSSQRDHGPGIVIPFATEIDGRNFFGKGPDLPFGNANFSILRNIKIRNYAIRIDGAEAALGLGADGVVFAFLLPVGESVLRENNNRPTIEEEPARPWAVVSQFLPKPPLVTAAEISDRTFNPWRSTAQVGGNFLNAVRRERDSEAQIELGQPLRFNTNLAGRSAWNTRWLLVIPGSQWTGESDPEVIRQRLLQFIYGTRADPQDLVGITDVRLILQAYSH